MNVGTLPRYIGALTLLSHLSVYQNSFGGPLPESVGSLTALKLLRAEYNSLTGTVLGVIFPSITLYSSGTIPDIWSSTQDLVTLNLAHNSLNGMRILGLLFRSQLSVGPIPTSFSALSKLASLHIHGNLLTGVWLHESYPPTLRRQYRIRSLLSV